MDQKTARDLINIMKISETKEFKNKDVLRKLIKISETTDNFSSSLGTAFINRVKKLLLGKDDDLKCILCKKNKTLNGIVCQNCIDLYNQQVQKMRAKKDCSNEKINKSEKIEKKYTKSLIGTIVYKVTAFMRKKRVEKKIKENELHKEHISGHRLIGLFCILLYLTYLFSVYAGAVVLFGGIVMAIYTFFKKISNYKRVSFGIVLISIIFWPIGMLLLCFGTIKKLGYLYKNGKYIGLGFAFYGYVALVCAYMHNIPGYRCSPGIVGYLEMIVKGDYGTRWYGNELSIILEMMVFLVGGAILVVFVVGLLALDLEEAEEQCCNSGLTVRQAFIKMLQSPIETLLIFVPLVLFVLYKIETLEDGWSLDIDNETHQVSAHRRFRNGKWEEVSASTRRNPDDIVNNNLSYRGNNPYNGSNPIRNNRHR